MKRNVALVASLLMLLACGGSTPSSSTGVDQPEQKDISIYAVQDPQIAAQLAVGMTQGFFTKHGLNVTPVYFSSGSAVAPGFASGGIQVGLASSLAMIGTIAAGLPVEMIGRVSDVSGGMGIVVSKDMGNQPTALLGKKLGMIKAAPSLVLFHNFTAKYGLDQSKIQIVNFTDPADLVTAFVRKDIDAVLIWNPAFSESAQYGNILVSGTTSYIGGSKEASKLFAVPIGMFTTPSFAKDNPKTLVAILRAFADATDWINSHQSQTATVLAGILKTPIDLTKEMVAQNTYTMTIDDSVMQTLDEETQFVYDAKLIKVNPKAKDYVDTSFLKTADPSAVKVSQ